MIAPNRRLLLALAVLAVVSRVAWVVWVHPPQDFDFKDMHAYLEHARRLVEHGLAPDRSMAFQAWGTHALLAVPIALFGGANLLPAALLWAAMGAAAVPITYLLACRVCARPGVAAAVGVAALLWYPNLANTGLFLSETPFMCALVATVWRLVVLLQDGRGAPGCGALAACCVALRPEVALFFALAAGLWWWSRGRSPAGWRHVAIVAAPVVLVLLFSLWHFHRHTGRWGGIAESARANLTPARCHHPWVQTFDKAEQLDRGPGLKAGSVYGVVSYYEMLQRGDAAPFALRPAFGTTARALEIAGPDGPMKVRVSPGGVSLQYVGHRADPRIHAAIQRACVAQTGWAGQLRVSAVNLGGLWFWNSHWPDNTRGGEPFRPWSDFFIKVFQWGVLAPSLLGVGLALRRARADPGLAVCALAIVAMMIVAAVWFGAIRLRTPYDPLALLLAAEAYAWLVVRRGVTGP